MQFGHKRLNLSRPAIMGILNVTPDSFSDGGHFCNIDSALVQAEKMLQEGADILDIGGESTRPGAPDVDLQQELERVIPIIEAIKANFDTVISIDTSKPQVMLEAVKHGASLINDVRALQQDDALLTAAKLDVNLCLMHMQGQPRTMQQQPEYQNVTAEVAAFLEQRIQACLAAGINKEKIIVDPGFGFGKSLQHNYQLLAQLDKLHELDVPVLVGMSRKSMLGNLLNRAVDERLAASVAVATIAAQKGAQFIRVHDVKETLDAVKIVCKIDELK